MGFIAGSMPDFTGYTIDDGRYVLEQLLGAGAYGVVYRARDLHAETDPSSPLYRAVKILRKAGPKKTDTTTQRREISLHRQMSSHPNVLTMYDAFEDSGYYYLVLEYCPGGDLFSNICEGADYKRSDEGIRSIFLQLVDAVHACHVKKISHRDIKPENILCSADGSTVYLSDFGLATSRKVSYVFGCGSSYYMSPECIGEETSASSYNNKDADVWALGVVLVNLVTGVNPWNSARYDDPFYRNFLRNENFFKGMLPISDGLDAILRSIFVLNPARRISLPKLRAAILSLDTFMGVRSVKAPAKPPAVLRVKAHSAPASAAPFTSHASLEAEGAPSKGLALAAVPAVPYLTSDYGSDSSASTSTSTSTSTSGFLSAGPITPRASVFFDPAVVQVACYEVPPSPELPTKQSAGIGSPVARLLERLQVIAFV